MKRFIAILMLFLFVVSPISANRGKLLFRVMEGASDALVELMPELARSSTEVTRFQQELVSTNLNAAFGYLGLRADRTRDSLMARLDSLPVTDNERAAHRDLLDFLNGDGPVSSNDIALVLESLRYFAVHYRDNKEGFFFPCPGCRGTDDNPIRMILNSGIVDIAESKVPNERVELDNLLNSELARREFPILDPGKMARIPLEYKQVWALMFQVSNYGQGYFKTIADAVIDGMKASEIPSENILDPRKTISDNRFYRLLFVESLSLEEVEIWTDIIKRVFNQKSIPEIRHGNERTMNGYAAFAERFYDSNMAKTFQTIERNFQHREDREALGWEEFLGTVDEYVASRVKQRGADGRTPKELLALGTVEAVKNAGDLMRREIERIENESPTDLRAAIMFAEGLLDDPYIAEAFRRNSRNSLEGEGEDQQLLRSLADLLVFLDDNPYIVRTVITKARDLVTGNRVDTENIVRRTAFAVFEEWFDPDTVEAVRNADNLVRTDMVNVEPEDRRAALTAFEELFDDPTIPTILKAFFKNTDSWVEELRGQGQGLNQ